MPYRGGIFAARALRRDAGRRWRGARAFSRARRLARRDPGRARSREAARSRPAVPPRRHHLRRLRRRRGRRAADPVRHHPAHHSRRRNGSALAHGPAPARHGAQPLPARHLSRAGHPQRRRDPGRAGAHATRPTRWRWSASTCRTRSTAHIAGIDLVRHDDGEYYVLEDNLRTPSGVSYMLENRKMMMRLFPELFARQHVRPVEHYPDLLLETLRAAAPRGGARPGGRRAHARASTTAPTSSTRSSRSRWASSWSKPRDLFVKDGHVYMHTTSGQQRVDVIYRRIDDAFLDPLAFRPDSMLGVPGLLVGLSRRQRRARQRDRHRRRRRQVDLSLRAGDDPLLSRRRADPAATCRPGSALCPTTCATCSITCRSWW